MIIFLSSGARLRMSGVFQSPNPKDLYLGPIRILTLDQCASNQFFKFYLNNTRLTRGAGCSCSVFPETLYPYSVLASVSVNTVPKALLCLD